MAQTFQQLQEQIEVLKAKAEQIRLAEIDEVIAKIKVAIEAYGISRQDLFGTGSAGSGRKEVRGAAQGGRAKYSDGKGNTWVGMGKRPRWLQEALVAGAKLEDFLSRVDASAPGASSPASAGQKAGKKRPQAKGGKAKYRDDAGNAWSGRGPRPRWLKEALASGKPLEDLRA